MSDLNRMEIALSGPLREAAEALARHEDITLGQLIHDALHAEIRQRHDQSAKTPNQANERLLAHLRALLASDLAEARDGKDLQGCLLAKGHDLGEPGACLPSTRGSEAHACARSRTLAPAL